MRPSPRRPLWRPFVLPRMWLRAFFGMEKMSDLIKKEIIRAALLEGRGIAMGDNLMTNRNSQIKEVLTKIHAAYLNCENEYREHGEAGIFRGLDRKSVV